MQMFANGLVQVTVPAWLITTSTTSAGVAGVVLLAMTVTMTVMGPFTGARSHIPYLRWFRYGLILCAAGLFGLAWASGPGPWWIAFPLLFVTGLGAGSLLTPSFNTFTGTVAGGEGVGIAMYNVLRLSFFAIGGLVGAAAVGTGHTWTAFLAAGTLCLLIAVRSAPAERLPPTIREGAV
jgi:MFS family permease